jgi:general secretion pathway protein A
MYQSHYNLRQLPFELTPDPSYLFLTPGHREALSNLEYGLFAAKSLTLLIGDAGTGKTTLLNTVLKSERCRNVRCVYVTNPALTRREFVNILAARFNLGDEAAQSKAVLVERLEQVLRQRRSNGEITALVVDEAQCLSGALLDEIRLLANIETPTQKLLPLVLAGQSELAGRLEQPELRQLKQRVALRCEISPFQLPESVAYIASRIKTAGGIPSRLFTKEAVMAIHEYSGGIPRTINVLCDNALMSGMALDRQTVDRAIVLEVCRDFALRTPGRATDTAAAGAAPAADRVPPIDRAPAAPASPATADEQPVTTTSFDEARPRRFSVFGSGLR